MPNQEKHITSIHIDVFDGWKSDLKNGLYPRANKVKVYYDLFELSRPELSELVTLIRMKTRWSCGRRTK